MKELEDLDDNDPLKCLAKTYPYARKLRKDVLIAEDKAIEKGTNDK